MDLTLPLPAAKTQPQNMQVRMHGAARSSILDLDNDAVALVLSYVDDLQNLRALWATGSRRMRSHLRRHPLLVRLSRACVDDLSVMLQRMADETGPPGPPAQTLFRDNLHHLPAFHIVHSEEEHRVCPEASRTHWTQSKNKVRFTCRADGKRLLPSSATITLLKSSLYTSSIFFPTSSTVPAGAVAALAGSLYAATSSTSENKYMIRGPGPGTTKADGGVHGVSGIGVRRPPPAAAPPRVTPKPSKLPRRSKHTNSLTKRRLEYETMEGGQCATALTISNILCISSPRASTA
ncbi:hypothetical protein DFJ73DRAFT_466291 [Zopfochytrium polystomum]|nr:hypothetical protein DFJ73DRAFT_466291 [Zopfochytrium polystomum]